MILKVFRYREPHFVINYYSVPKDEMGGPPSFGRLNHFSLRMAHRQFYLMKTIENKFDYRYLIIMFHSSEGPQSNRLITESIPQVVILPELNA